MSVVCLLPARNAAADLPGYMESASRFCDAIVALDDGSTDDTRRILEQSRFVQILLTNPPRRRFHGWHDGVNRNRLLLAASELDPDWIISIDADERLDPTDAAAFRGFIETDALPGCAYGLQHFRMWGPRQFDPHFTWIYRLFAFEPGQAFPNRRLHFNPVPTSIPRPRWVRTTIRVQHLGADDEVRQLERLEKYRDVDPAGEYTTDQGGLGKAPAGDLPRWRARSPNDPILYPARGEPRRKRRRLFRR
ncbi:MAG: glycosyltransferase family 2 protein [Actinomycetota bacterium]